MTNNGEIKTNTLVSLRDYMDMRLNAMEKAVAVALAASDRRLDTMNEFRGAMSDMTREMATRDEVDLIISPIRKEVQELRDFRVFVQSKASQESVDVAQQRANIAMLIGLVGLALTIIKMFQ